MLFTPLTSSIFDASAMVRLSFSSSDMRDGMRTMPVFGSSKRGSHQYLKSSSVQPFGSSRTFMTPVHFTTSTIYLLLWGCIRPRFCITHAVMRVQHLLQQRQARHMLRSVQRFVRIGQQIDQIR